MDTLTTRVAKRYIDRFASDLDQSIRSIDDAGFDALAEQMKGLKDNFQGDYPSDPSHVADIIENDFGAELAAGVATGDIKTKREYQKLVKVVLDFGKALLGSEAPRKLRIPSHHKKVVTNLR
jgi:hypothetical protein